MAAVKRGAGEVQDKPPHAQKAEEGPEDGWGHSEALLEEFSLAKTGQCFEKKSRLPLGWNVEVHSPPYEKKSYKERPCGRARPCPHACVGAGAGRGC